MDISQIGKCRIIELAYAFIILLWFDVVHRHKNNQISSFNYPAVIVKWINLFRVHCAVRPNFVYSLPCDHWFNEQWMVCCSWQYAPRYAQAVAWTFQGSTVSQGTRSPSNLPPPTSSALHFTILFCYIVLWLIDWHFFWSFGL